MAGEAILFNPRGRKHRRKKATARRRTRRHRGRFVRAHSNPMRRRRRRSSRRRVHVRRRHNPRFGLAGLRGGAMTGLGIAGGVVATNIATSLVLSKVPGIPDALQSGVGKMALKAGIGVIALPMLLKAVRQPALARNVVIGAWAAVVLDAYAEWIQPQLAAAGLADYETASLSEYQPAMLEGDESNIEMGGSIYEGGAYD